MKNLIIFFPFLFLLLSEKAFSQNSEEIGILSNILDCIEKGNKAKKNITDEMHSYLNNYNPFNVQKVYKFMQDNLDLVKQCTDDLNDIPEYMVRFIIPFQKLLENFNWKNYLDCILKNDKKDGVLDNLIDLINKKEYLDATVEEIKLVQQANEIVLICSRKKDENVSFAGVFIGDEDIF